MYGTVDRGQKSQRWTLWQKEQLNNNQLGT
jgi:hypothetical protein